MVPVLAAEEIGLVDAMLTGIYSAAVYRYAAAGEVSAGFSPAMVEGAFRVKVK